MLRIIKKNQVYFIGKVSDLLEVLEDLTTQYDTVKSFIEAELKSQ